MDRVVPFINTAVLSSGVKTSPAAVSAPRAAFGPGAAVARGKVDVPMISDEAEFNEYVVPLSTTAEEPGRSVEPSILIPPPLLGGSAV